MKVKNVNFFQQHVEKLILGAGLLVALLLLFWYVLGTPYAATVGGREFGPGELEDHVVDQVNTLQQRINSPEAPFPERSVPTYAREFRQRLDSPVFARDGYVLPMSQAGLDPSDVSPPTPEDWPLVQPPVPVNVMAQSGFGVLGDIEDRQQREQLVQLVGDHQPADFRYVTVVGDFPLLEWQQRLEESPLPNLFYRNKVNITGVYLQRQELDPTSGEWTNTTIVPKLPTQPGFLPTYRREWTKEEAPAAVQYVQQTAESIARPEFPPLANGLWLPPDPDRPPLTAEQQREVMELRQDIEREKRAIELLRRRIERRQNRPGAENRPAEPTPDFGSLMEQGLDDPASQRQRVAPPRGDEETARLERSQRKLAELQHRLNELIGVSPDAPQSGQPDDFMPYDVPMDGPQGPFDPRFEPNPYTGQVGPATPAGQATDVSETVRVWAHDLTVEPGKTYRYRILVSVLNPLFRQSQLTPEQHEEHFNKISLEPAPGEVEASPWSNPVKVHPERYFFFLGGNAGSQVGEVEVWRIYNGQWVVEEFNGLQPGDPIGGTKQLQINGEEHQVDLNTGRIVVDLTSGGGANSVASDTRLLYLNPESQVIEARSAMQDRDSADRIRLLNERAMQQATQTVAQAPPPR